MNQHEPAYEQLLDELRQKDRKIQQLEAKIAIQQRQIDELQYQAHLLDFVLDIVISSDTEFNLVTWNKAAEMTYGWKAEEVIGQNATQLFQTQYIDDLDPHDVYQQYKLNGVWRGRMIHHHKDGTPIPVRGTTTLIRDGDGGIIGSVAVLRDISQELAAEKSIRENREFYQIISEIMSDYAYRYYVNEDGTWGHMWTTLESFERVTGYKHRGMLRQYDLFHPDDVERIQRDIERTVAGENTEGEYRIITKDGEVKWIYVRRRFIWDDVQKRVTGFYGAVKDITSRKLAVEQLHQYNLEQERVAILRNFIQDASHDLKTPLSTINTSLYILRSLITDEKQVAHLEKLEFHVNRFTQLIEDMFEMSRLDLLADMPLSQVNINAHLRDCVGVRQVSAARFQIEVVNNVGMEPLYIHANATLLLQAINNIIDNAIQYTPANGTVTISNYIEDRWIVISIKDTGIGIPKEELPHIFERFYRGDKARGSNSMSATGLGLSITDKIIRLHDGRIEVTSEVGQGTNFHIYLPRPD